MMFSKSVSWWMRKSPVTRLIHQHHDTSAERTKALRNVSKSLHKIGKMRFEADKTASNVYEHFADPTAALNGDTKPSERLKDFDEIHSVTVNFGSPEMADQMSGSIYMHASMVEDKCSQVGMRNIANNMTLLFVTLLRPCTRQFIGFLK